MDINMFVSNTYYRLLADVCTQTKVSLDIPSLITYEWAYIYGPKLDKEILKYLEGRQNSVITDMPEWLLPLWDRFVFTDDPIYLRALRQILLFCYKTELKPHDEQLRTAQAVFEETDAGVGVWSRSFASWPYSHTLASARRIVGSVIYRINWSEITPSHGPGSVFPTRAPHMKSDFRTLYSSIERFYPFTSTFCALHSEWSKHLWREGNGPIRESDDIVAKLVAVPKDSRGPRLICVHPSESIWIQQGQRRLLEARITSHPLTRGKINFTDQTVNGKLALSSSLSREFVTLDLKEASDRISMSLVKALFGDYAYDILSCSRANKIKLLYGRVITLEKWAPMGNALCFPVQSLIFFALVIAGIKSHHNESCDDVYVFGDDIIFPRKYFAGVITTLVTFGLVPNIDKTFVTGFFRESCGVDAYKGIDVTPLRLRKSSCHSLADLESQTNLALRARLAGYESVAVSLYKEIRRVLLHNYRITMPITNNRYAGGFTEYQDIPLAELILREPTIVYNNRWQCWMIKRWTVTGRQFAVRSGEWFHLQDSLIRLLIRSSDYESDSEVLSERGLEYAVPHRNRLQRGWSYINI